MVIDASLLDKKGRFVPDACEKLMVKVAGPAEILGWGNGDPGFKAQERPEPGGNGMSATIDSFMGNAQIIIRGTGGAGRVTVKVSLPNGAESIVTLND